MPDIMKRISIQLIVLFVILAAGIIAAGFIYTSQYSTHYRTEAERQLTAINNLKISELSQWRSERIGGDNVFYGNTAFNILARKVFSDPSDTASSQQIKSWFKKVQTSYGYDQILLIDTAGRRHLSIPLKAGISCGDWIYYLKDVRSSGRVILTDFHRAGSDKPVHLSVIVPIVDEYGSGRINGFIVMVIDPVLYLYPLLKHWPTPSGSAESLLVRRDGDDVLVLNELRSNKSSALNVRNSIENEQLPEVMAVMGCKGVAEGVDYRGMKVAATLSSVPGSPWHLVSKIDLSEMYGPIKERFLIMVVAVIGLIFTAGTGILVLWRRQNETFYRNEFKAAEALRGSEALYRDLVQNANSMIIRFRRDGTISFFNEYAQSFFGYTADEAVDKNMSILIPDKDSAGSDLTGLVENIINSPENYAVNINENICMDGHRVWVRWINKPVYNDKGEFDEILAVGSDITERKLAEELLKASEVRYRRLFETAQDGILILDAESGMIVDVNPFMINILGFSYEQFQGKTIWDIGFFKDIIPNKDKFLELQGEEYVRYEDLPLETAAGRMIDVEFISNVYEIEGEKIIQCNIRDITDRIRVENERKYFTIELERSNLELQQFAYVASHDLQEPLRMITSYLQLLDNRYGSKLDEDAHDFIKYAVDGASRLQMLIIGLLEYSRVSTHGDPFKKIDLKKIIPVILKDLEVQIMEAEAVVEYGELPEINGDESQIVRLFQNLIQNGIKFRRKGVKPHVIISSEKNGSDYIFCVKDTGIGIEKQYFERIFIIFQRLHSKDEYPGTGIGLSLCKKIVERHGGKIWIESELGEGASFYFTIPGGIQ
jgi:PAS domain S-box-containing protein